MDRIAVEQYPARIFSGRMGKRFLVFLCALLLGGAAFWFLTAPSTEPVALTMQGYVLNTDGSVQETIEVGVVGTAQYYRDVDRRDELDVEIQLPDSFRYQFSRDDPPYYRLPGMDSTQSIFEFCAFGYDKIADESEFFYFALDTELGYLVMNWQKGTTFPVSYLVAAADPSVTPQEILDHFDWLENLP